LESGWLSHEKLHDVPVDAVLVGGFKHFFYMGCIPSH
jgi:hypothetical protein